ncbi:PREDICTED: sulfhydryl oxidase 2-like [Thamnophis sirtalis]|uniref:Sulfhydryl oxidase 2-like n=1 Tax=Thamnophis sirtalis TaxID=35019 RepID=A0A6I9YGK9_9SAUR|nr:PREDICTED: sulfhydryl oxidase 2-like [Thamnophis sirtalis]
MAAAAEGSYPAPLGPRQALRCLLALLAMAAPPAGARLYQAGVDPVWVLEGGAVREALRDSASAWLVQFYSSSCGHCVAFAPTWRALAGDVHEWDPAIRIGVLDCGDEKNYEPCKEYGIQYYPTFRYFKAFTKQFTVGENHHATSDRDLQTIRQTMIDFLQNHSREAKPPACPTLEPTLPEEVFSLFNKHSQHYTAIIFESGSSYLGREVILDLGQYENMAIKRVLNSETALLEKLGITSVPSLYLVYPNGSHGLINNLKPLRSFFSSHLKSLPGVRRKLTSPLPLLQQKRPGNTDVKEWKEFDQSKLYMADLESGLHYLFRVELATHKTLEGPELRTLKDTVLLLAKVNPLRLLVGFLQPAVNHAEQGLFLSSRTRLIKWRSDEFMGKEKTRFLFGGQMAHSESLTGDLSEDPQFPKVQWPTLALCPACHKTTQGPAAWDKTQVLQFLKQHYGSHNLVHTYLEEADNAEGQETQDGGEGFPKEAAPEANKGRDPQESLGSKSKGLDHGRAKEDSVIDPGKRPGGSVVEQERKQAVSFLGVGFSSIDMSLCVVLYVASSLFLMIMFFFFRVRSRRWKVRHNRPHV